MKIFNNTNVLFKCRTNGKKYVGKVKGVASTDRPIIGIGYILKVEKEWKKDHKEYNYDCIVVFESELM